MTWWLWAVLGLLLLAAETIIPAGLFLLFFGVAALLIALLLSVAPIVPFWLQWVLFAIGGPALALAIRPHVRGAMSRTPAKTDIDRFVGEQVVALDSIGIGVTGQVEHRGTSWQATNVGQLPIAKGERCVIMAIDNLTLSVSKQ